MLCSCIFKYLELFCSVRILNDIIVFSSTIFIFDLIFVSVEKRRFLVFALMEEAEGFTVLVHVFPQEASTFPLRIIHSDSEYELLPPIHIASSYQLNLITKVTLASQDSVWDVKFG